MAQAKEGDTVKVHTGAFKNGSVIPVKIVDVADETAAIDANHPLAGKELTFTIKLVEILQ